MFVLVLESIKPTTFDASKTPGCTDSTLELEGSLLKKTRI